MSISCSWNKVEVSLKTTTQYFTFGDFCLGSRGGKVPPLG